jgi:hypothetical protein
MLHGKWSEGTLTPPRVVSRQVVEIDRVNP